MSLSHLQDIPIDIVFEDEHLLVVNKPAGMVVHPSPGHWESGTLVNALLHHWQMPPIFADIDMVGEDSESNSVTHAPASLLGHLPSINLHVAEGPQLKDSHAALPCDQSCYMQSLMLPHAAAHCSLRAQLLHVDHEDLSEDDASGVWGAQSQALQALRPGIVHRLDKGTTGMHLTP